MTSQLRFALALASTNVKASFALRASFWMQASFMLLNNLLYFTTWWILFQRFPQVRGWTLADVSLLYGVAAGGFGLCVVFAGNVRNLAGSIVNGDLDSALTQPKSVLVQTSMRRSQPSGWGDVATAVLLFISSGHARWQTLPAFVLGVLCAALVFVASAIVLHSLAFWLGRVEALSRMLWDFTLTFALYPPSLFSGALKLLLFTALPAGFISYLPVELIRAPSLTGFIYCVGGCILYVTFAVLMFSRSLRRYASGNRFGHIA